MLRILAFDDHPTFVQELRQLAQVLEVPTKAEDAPVYSHQPALPDAGKVRRLTLKQRRQVESLSTERGYRQFGAEFRSAI